MKTKILLLVMLCAATFFSFAIIQKSPKVKKDIVTQTYQSSPVGGIVIEESIEK